MKKTSEEQLIEIMANAASTKDTDFKFKWIMALYKTRNVMEPGDPADIIGPLKMARRDFIREEIKTLRNLLIAMN